MGVNIYIYSKIKLLCIIGPFDGTHLTHITTNFQTKKWTVEFVLLGPYGAIWFLTYIFHFFSYRQQRYVAYRQLVRWCWGYLGKDIRVVLPACAVKKIRLQFPSDDYRGFQDVWNVVVLPFTTINSCLHLYTIKYHLSYI